MNEHDRGKAVYQVVCTCEFERWKHFISSHSGCEEAVIAASGYRSMYLRNFGFANPQRRRWMVRRVVPAAAFGVPEPAGERTGGWNG